MIKKNNSSGFYGDHFKEIRGFTCKCDKCGSDDVAITDSVAMGSSWTGQYGSVDLICNNCKNIAEIYS